MKTIVIIGGIILAGATVIAVVQNDKKKNAAPEVHQAGDGHDHSGVPAETQAGSLALNPAHGLPGHRCDLVVGAPLNSPSGAAAPAAQVSSNISMSPGPQATPSAAAGVKVNPAHGLPGHRCDLAVGAPLNSPSRVATPVQASSNISMSPGPQATPSAAAAGVKVNPAHGLPGHRCDLAVGAPLDSPSGAAAPAQASPNISMGPQTTPSAVPAGVKVNPAHGLPGHRCDLQVGAPLT